MTFKTYTAHQQGSNPKFKLGTSPNLLRAAPPTTMHHKLQPEHQRGPLKWRPPGAPPPALAGAAASGERCFSRQGWRQQQRRIIAVEHARGHPAVSPQSPEPARCELVLSASPASTHRPSPSECGEARDTGSRVESGLPGPTGRNEEAGVREAGANLLPRFTAALPTCTVALTWSYQCVFPHARPPSTRENHRGVLGQGP